MKGIEGAPIITLGEINPYALKMLLTECDALRAELQAEKQARNFCHRCDKHNGEREALIATQRACVADLRVSGWLADDEGDVTDQLERIADMLAADAPIQERESSVANLSMMVRRLALAIRRNVDDPHKDLTLANECLKWLQKNELTGSPLRDAAAPPAPQARELSDSEIDDIWASVDLDIPPYINFVRSVLAARSGS